MDGNTRQQKQLAILFLVNITVYSEAQKGTSHYWLGLQGRQRPPLGSFTQTWNPCILQCNNCRERSTRTYPLSFTVKKKTSTTKIWKITLHDTSCVWYLRAHHTVKTVVLHANICVWYAKLVGTTLDKLLLFRVTDLCNEQNL